VIGWSGHQISAEGVAPTETGGSLALTPGSLRMHGP